MPLFWCSVVNDKGFVGAVIIKCGSKLQAMAEAKKISGAAGGSIACWEIPKSAEAAAEVKKWGVGKLFNPLGVAGYKKMKEFTNPQTKKIVDELATYAHVECLDKAL